MSSVNNLPCKVNFSSSNNESKFTPAAPSKGFTTEISKECFSNIDKTFSENLPHFQAEPRTVQEIKNSASQEVINGSSKTDTLKKAFMFFNEASEEEEVGIQFKSDGAKKEQIAAKKEQSAAKNENHNINLEKLTKTDRADLLKLLEDKDKFIEHTTIIIPVNGKVTFTPAKEIADKKELEQAMSENRVAFKMPNNSLFIHPEFIRSGAIQVENGRATIIDDHGNERSVVCHTLTEEELHIFTISFQSFVNAKTDITLQMDDIDKKQKKDDQNPIDDSNKKPVLTKELINIKEKNKEEIKETIGPILSNIQKSLSEKVSQQVSDEKKQLLKFLSEEKVFKYSEVQFERLQQSVLKASENGKGDFNAIAEKWANSLTPPFAIRSVNDSVLWKELKKEMVEEFKKQF